MEGVVGGAHGSARAPGGWKWTSNSTFKKLRDPFKKEHDSKRDRNGEAQCDARVMRRTVVNQKRGTRTKEHGKMLTSVPERSHTGMRKGGMWWERGEERDFFIFSIFSFFFVFFAFYFVFCFSVFFLFPPLSPPPPCRGLP